MKMEFKIPDRFCSTHGVKLRVVKLEDQFDVRTGALKQKLASYKCPKWFCSRTSHEFIVFEGRIAEGVQ